MALKRIQGLVVSATGRSTRITPRAPIGQLRKIAILGGAATLRFAPFHDLTWELWSHASCRKKCLREPDVFFDLHPPELWRDGKKKNWDPNYYAWVKQNHVPIYMQDHYDDVPCSLRYPFETMITEFPRGYMANSASYMIALALMSGVTHLGVYGCHYDSLGEYGPQRGSMEYWLGVAEGRGVHVLIPPTCDLLNRPSLLYGYQSHPDGKRDPSYKATVCPIPPKTPSEGHPQPKPASPQGNASRDLSGIIPVGDPDCPPLMTVSFCKPALERANGLPVSIFGTKTA